MPLYTGQVQMMEIWLAVEGVMVKNARLSFGRFRSEFPVMPWKLVG